MLPLAQEVTAPLHNPPGVCVDALPIVGDDVVERHVSELFLGVAQRLTKCGVGSHDTLGLDIDQRYVLRSLLDHRAVELLALPDRFFGPLALDGCAQSVGRSLQRVDLGGGPLALACAVVEPDSPPPLPFGEDRHDRYGENVLLFKLGLLVLRELPRATVDRLPPAH